MVELAVLGVLDAATAGRPRAHVQSAKALAGIDERIGLGPWYAFQLLLDLARPWLVPVRIVAMDGDYGDRNTPMPAGPEYTRCRPSHTGQLVLDAEASRLPPIPVGLINGTTSRGGTQPALDPFAVLAALRRILDDPGVPDGELLSIAGHPWSGTGCTLTGDLAALARGRRVMLRETGQITITGVPVPQASTEPQPPGDDVPLYASAHTGRETFPAHLVIDSLPARTVPSEVAQAIAGRSASWLDSHPGPPWRAALPVAHVDDQSRGAEVRIVLALRPGSDPEAVRDRLATIRGVSSEVPAKFPASLTSLLRSWVNDHRGEDIAASLTELETAIRRDRQRDGRSGVA